MANWCDLSPWCRRWRSSLPEHALVFADAKSRKIEVPVRANTGKTAGDVHLEVPAGWKVEPASRHFELAAAEEQTNLSFDLTPPQAARAGRFAPWRRWALSPCPPAPK